MREGFVRRALQGVLMLSICFYRLIIRSGLSFGA